jgi:hypothetical protein
LFEQLTVSKMGLHKSVFVRITNVIQPKKIGSNTQQTSIKGSNTVSKDHKQAELCQLYGCITNEIVFCRFLGVSKTIYL